MLIKGKVKRENGKVKNPIVSFGGYGALAIA